jgi:hypothetical protein
MPSTRTDHHEPRSALRSTHSVVALVGRIDRRAVVAVEAGRLLGGDQLTALHVVEPGEDLDDLARRWMGLRCSSVPLATVDSVDATDVRCAGVADAVVEAVTAADPATVVTLVLSHLQHRRRWHRWLHDQTARQIASAVQPLPHVHVLWVPIPVAV